MRLDWFSGGAMGMRFLNLQVDEEAGIMSLWPNSTVHDVSLEYLDWSDNGKPWILWQGAELDSNEVLNIQAYLIDSMPVLRITSTNANGERERWYITDSGEDGSLLLLSWDVYGEFFSEP